MKHLLRLILNNAPLKIISIILAYSVWAEISTHREYDKHIEIPVCFFGSEPEASITCPETILVTLRGTRRDLKSLDVDNLALHINSDRLPSGAHEKVIHESDLFLPASIKLVHYQPNNLVISKEHLHK